VNTIVPDKKGMTRGMTEKHASFEEAKKHLDILATRAVAKGWVRKASASRGFVVRPDAFTEIPAPVALPVAKGKK
jgi:hypothetical protein